MEETKKYRYPGINSFDTDDIDIYFGRKNDRIRLADRVEVEKNILLYSRSGLGKTSLLKAGLLPELSERGFHPFYIRLGLYQQGSLSPVQHVIRKTILQDQKALPATFLQKFIAPTNSLWHAFKSWQIEKNSNTKSADRPFVLIFDQFEEIGSYPDRQINMFKQQLAELLSTNIPQEYQQALKNDSLLTEPLTDAELDLLYKPLRGKLVFAIRSDQMSVLNKLSDYLPNILNVNYELKPLTATQARLAIVEPAKKVGNFETPPFEYQQDALEKIMDALASGKSNEIDTAHLQILLQYVELELVQKQRHNNITAKLLGDLNKVYENYYHNCLGMLHAERETAQELIEDKLIADRRRVSYDKALCLQLVGEATLDKLVETRLLRAEPNTMGGISYEVSHDSLVKPILEAREERKRTEEEKEKQTELENKLAEQQKKQKQQQLILLIVTGALILSMALGVWAVNAQSEAVKAKAEVEKAKGELQKAKDEVERQKNEYQAMLVKYFTAEITYTQTQLNKVDEDIVYYKNQREMVLLEESKLTHARLLRKIDTLKTGLNLTK
jgi:hypothetical protein